MYRYSYRLVNLQHLSMDNNQLTELPVELCALSRLEELHIANNQLIGLPLEFGFLINLEKLHLQKNRIRELPEVRIAKMKLFLREKDAHQKDNIVF